MCSLVLLPLSSGLWRVGANAVARTRCAAGCRFLPSLAARSSFLAGSACPVLTRCCRLAGTQPTLLRDKQLCCCMALLRHIQVPPSAVSPRLYSAFLQLYLGCFAGGWLCLAVCSCMQVVSLPLSNGALGFSRPMPMSTVKQTASLSPTVNVINLQTVIKPKKDKRLKDKWVMQD